MGNAFFIGIAGGSASGKSTLCDLLEKELRQYKTKVFHMDDYFKAEEDRPYSKAPITNTSYIDDNHPDTIDFSKLYSDLSIALNSDSDFVILEGLFVLWEEEICSKLDLKLFVDCRPDERIVRRLRRNMAWGLTFDEISNVYLDLVRYRHDEYVEPTKWKADLIINGSNASPHALNAILGIIKNRNTEDVCS
jgi:uridine kinase